ncbi:MAG: cardiolipin synthase [Lachnospiraceae bacterium]|nr:cardiolipin synthase [Lachnospiraceae bacterium]
MKKTTGNTIGRIIFVFLAIIIQVLWIIFMIVVLGNRYRFITTIINLLSVLAVLWLVSKDMNPAYKLAWTILILVVPIAGAVIYFLFGRQRLATRLKDREYQLAEEAAEVLREDGRVREALKEENSVAERQSNYIWKCAGFPLFQDTKTRYFCCGEEFFPVFLEELEKAEHFIFMEYFIIDNGEMWQSVLDVLERKAKLGVDVRMIYDDWGCASKMPQTFEWQLKARGIRCEVFNPLVPVISVVMNNRDHRKITVIDGHTAFTGGINLADEYINRIERFGYWKDSALMMHGEAVWGFTVMFLRMWSLLAKENVSYEKYSPHRWHETPFSGAGYVQPYCDTPLDHETTGENVYLNIINRAKEYVYIFTPYLIIDNEMQTALTLAAKSGIDIRIVTPGIPDKKVVFLLTQSYYEPLIRAGVRIYEYMPGFIHAKSFVCDDEIAVVGSINLDYRSLYLHFECGVWMYGTEAVMEVKKDSLAVFEECREITLEECENKTFARRFSQSVLRLFAPLM